MVPENIEKANSKIISPCMPISPPSISTNLDISTNPDIDAKQPDSSNGSEEVVDPMLQPQTVSLSEKSTSPEIDVSSELQDTMKDKNIETVDIGESIQVAEISSSQMPEEIGEAENKIADKTILDKLENFENEKKQVVEQNENEKAKIDNTQIPIQSNLKSNKPELKELVDETCGVSNVTRQNTFSDTKEEAIQPAPLLSRLRRSGGIVPVKSKSFDSGEVRNNVLNGSRHKQQHSLFPAARTDVRTIKRRHSLNSSQTQNVFMPTPDPKTYVSVKSRYSRVSKSSVAENASVDETTKNTSKLKADTSCKRRHSTITQVSVASTGVENECTQQEPCAKRRTRSEDRRQNPTDENDPANQTMENASGRLSWPTSDGRPDSTLSLNTTTLSSSFQRRSLAKKATPVKTIRRPSINGSKLQQLRGSFLRDWDQGRSNRANNCNDRRTLNRTVSIIGPTDTTMPQRWLRLVQLIMLFLFQKLLRIFK